ncbi:MAG: glutamate formimidoyltransferase [Chitinophagales bacterium]|nr:glutamate formimidoyltransferase [Chitinophagales bacterium]
MQLVECIPNFSEGRNPIIVNAIAESIKKTPNVWLLNIDSGYDANRTVYTFVGDIDTITEAAFSAVMTASELIDMSVHQGEHPRIGACDVFPFVALDDTDESILLQKVKVLAERLGDNGIPVYLYEKSALRSDRKNLATIRKGEYESLPEKLKLEGGQPDFGPKTFNEKFGAMVMGVRDFLLAYNINLESKDIGLAKKIAARVRESGNPGLLKGVKAIGWWMEEYQCTQVSMNIVDVKNVDLKFVFDTVKKEAAKEGIEVQTSELIGLIPQQMIKRAGNQILPGERDIQKLYWAVFNYLGLNMKNDIRIIEWKISEAMKNASF